MDTISVPYILFLLIGIHKTYYYKVSIVNDALNLVITTVADSAHIIVEIIHQYILTVQSLLTCNYFCVPCKGKYWRVKTLANG